MFKIADFLKQKYVDRTEFIKIPELEKFFNYDESVAVEDRIIGVKVRGLTGNEYARAISESRKDLTRVAMELLGASSQAIAASVKELLGVGESPQMIEQRVIMFEYGLVWPEIKDDQRLPFAVKLNKVLPLAFLRITNKISELTEQGQCPEG